MIAPVVPGLTDHEIRGFARAADAGACFAGYIMLRLPHGVGPLFEAWLERHFPIANTKCSSGHATCVTGGSTTRGSVHGCGGAARLPISWQTCSCRARSGRTSQAPSALSTEAFRRPGRQPSLF
jgi:hypothetical protein